MKSTPAKASIISHLSELRKRLIIIFAVNIVAMLICYQYTPQTMELILNAANGFELVYLTPSELFIVYIKLALTLGIILASPITLYQIYSFIKSGLYSKEKLMLALTTLVGIAFFILGVFFCYTVVLPITTSFFQRITISEINAMISVAAFTSFMTSMLVAFGFVFELPVVIVLLSVFKLIDPRFLWKKQSYVVLVIFIVAAFITPPDVISQLALALPMVVLFNISIGVSMLLTYKRGVKHG